MRWKQWSVLEMVVVAVERWLWWLRVVVWLERAADSGSNKQQQESCTAGRSSCGSGKESGSGSGARGGWRWDLVRGSIGEW